MSKFPSQEMDRFNLRFPEGMREAIAERAKRNGRSMNSEIIQIIEDTLNRDNLINAAVDENISDKLDESKVSELEILQEKIIAIQRSEVNLLRQQVDILRRMAGQEKED
ncbi:Arc family DNA-binding protein [Cronobacter sakazakii]|nr:Arc family DNA-binding protein [Cronobacter sakazakii]EGT5751083.1 Arc family DNA-binding protein [Cronobacter sakazakii]ELY2861543.1 Arc family DNA-binding protein [Cronobacter sakazakii]ELY4225223.1 Arc family DNA-binding protein [Cronobacter sakazakii]ELY4596852.1 Arc family DNA-binding protein [Cronobacter sakazakii]